jgi:hypothetical protein
MIHPPIRSHQRRLVLLGLGLGTVFGVWDLVVTATDPLGEDTAFALLTFYGPMFAAWGLASFGVSRQTGRLVDGLWAGALVAFATFVIFDLFAIGRANLFLETLTARTDWQNLMRNYPGVKVESLRAYITKSYLAGAPFKVLVATLIGTMTGLLGALAARIPRAGGITLR